MKREVELMTLEEIIANIAPIIPNINDKLFIIGMIDVHIPIIPNTNPAVAKPLFFFSSIRVPPFILYKKV